MPPRRKRDRQESELALTEIPEPPRNAKGQPICGAAITGTSRRPGAKTEGICEQLAGWGTDHPGWGRCKMHMGATPAVAKNAARQQLASIVRLADRRDVSPETVLLEEVARGAGAVAYFDALVAQLDDPTTPRADLLISAWNEQRKLLAAVSTAIVKAGLREREVRVMEMQARMMADVFLSMISDPTLNLSAEQKVAARTVLAGQLRNLAQPAIDTTAS